MATEAKRGFIRIISNYGRLLTTFLLGLLLVRLQLLGLGEAGLALIALLGSTIGLAAMVQFVMASSLVRELGAAHHSGDSGQFITVYNAALVLSLIGAVFSTLIFAGVWMIVPLLRMPDELVVAARWLVAVRGLESAFVIITAPAFNMYRVTERMVAMNVWTTLGRSTHFIVAFVLFGWLGHRDPAQGLIDFAIYSTLLFVIVQGVSTAIIVAGDRRLLPRPWRVSREGLRSLVNVGGWNALMVTAMQLHFPVDALIMNTAFGLRGNLTWGLSAQMVSYVRMLTTGVTEGLDAVAARVSSTGENRLEAIQRLIHQSTRLHGLVSFPAALFVFILAEPALTLWVGDRIEPEGRAENIAMIVVLIRVLALGMLIRSISDGWQRILYGAGHVREFALLTLAGGLANPMLAVLLIWTLPGEFDFTGPAWGFTAIMLLFHFILLPLVGARLLGITFSRMLSGLNRPLLVTLGCAPPLIAASLLIEQWTLLHLGGVIACFGALYMIAAWFGVLAPAERRRFGGALLRGVRTKRPAAR